MPPEADNYVHRIGRTGRAGRSGYSKSLFNPKDGRDKNQADSLRAILKDSNMPIPSWLNKLADRIKDHKEMQEKMGIKSKQRKQYRVWVKEIYFKHLNFKILLLQYSMCKL